MWKHFLIYTFVAWTDILHFMPYKKHICIYFISIRKTIEKPNSKSLNKSNDLYNSKLIFFLNMKVKFNNQFERITVATYSSIIFCLVQIVAFYLVELTGLGSNLQAYNALWLLQSSFDNKAEPNWLSNIETNDGYQYSYFLTTFLIYFN